MPFAAPLKPLEKSTSSSTFAGSPENTLATAERLRAWLLHGPAQLRGGDHSGGVAGVIDEHGQPRYVYAEITGYYLSWLADIAAGVNDAELGDRARAALDWSAREFSRSGQAPPTRIYLNATDEAPGQVDWRNDALFFFDLAMLLRGIDAVSEAGLAWPNARLRTTLHDHLAQFVAEGCLTCAVQIRGTQALPKRWSTTGGPFLVKASSRVAFSSRHAALPAPLMVACENDSNRWAEQAADIDLGMLHPTLYFAEGLLLSRPGKAPEIARLLRRCLDLMHADGSLPETADVGSKVRNDIIAQALRIGVLLRQSNPAQAPSQHALDALAQTLVARIGDGNFLAFNAATPNQANVWCTMFAEQALRWHAQIQMQNGRRISAVALV